MRQIQRRLWLGVGVAVLALASSCSTEATEEATEPASQRAEALAAAGCVTHSGFTHCSLGEATLTPSKDGKTLKVAGARSAQKDGVAVVLPDVTSFTPDGKVGGGAGSTFVARSLSAGVSTSSLTVRKSFSGYTVSAAYTGSGDTSRYDAILFNGGAQVGRLRDLGPLDSTRVLYDPDCPRGSTLPWPDCIWIRPNPFDITPYGACNWDLVLGSAGQVELANGQMVTVDRISFEEIVPASGSYPYLTFDRIDYTGDVGSFVLEAESAR